MIAVTFALPVESSEFVRLLKNPHENSREGVESIRGELDGRTIAVLHTGVGEKACRPRIETFLRREQIRYVISAGFAGGLDPELKVGHLFLADNFSSPALLQSPNLDLAEENLFVGKLVTAPGIADSTTERERIAAATGGSAVDMETQFIAEACTAHEIRLLSLRAITDTAAEPLPAPPSVLFNIDKQRTSLPRLAAYLAMHPGAIGKLKTFRDRIAQVRHSLTAVLVSLVRSNLS